MNQTALVLIDIQQGFDDPCWGNRNNPNAEKNIARLLAKWREKNLPVIHVQHCSIEPLSPLRPNLPGCQFKPEAMPLEEEVVFTKQVNSAFIGTDLEEYLHQQSINYLVIAGLTTDHCISTTTRMAGNLGFNVRLVSDATATFDRKDFNGHQYSADEIHNIHLASLHKEFCTVVTTNDVLK